MPPTLKKIGCILLLSSPFDRSFVLLFVHSFDRYVRSSFVRRAFCAQHSFRTMYANIMKFHIWIPHEKNR